MNEKIPFTDEQLNWLENNLSVKVYPYQNNEFEIRLCIADKEVSCDFFTIQGAIQ